MRRSECSDCGQGFDVASMSGPLPARCGPCTTVYAKAAAKVRSDRYRATRKSVARIITCTDCDVVLPWDRKSRPRLRCDVCLIEHTQRVGAVRSAEWRQANLEKARERERERYQKQAEKIRDRKLGEHYKRLYGITRAERDAMQEAQGGLCAICKQPPDPRHQGASLHIDHCHATGKIRGLLCGHCNTMLGLAKDSEVILQAAIAYLRG